MRCQGLDHKISAYLDGQLTDVERREVAAHLGFCSGCAGRADDYRLVRSSLRSAPAHRMPAKLATSLLVIASRERARQVTHSSLPALIAHWRENVRLWSNNLMRPLAIPTAGGLASAVLLFSMLAPNFTHVRIPAGEDVPTALYTEARVKTLPPFALRTDEVILDLTVDEEGRVIEYSLLGLEDPEALRTVENHLLFTRFAPATTFGQPVSSKLRLSLRRSRIEVRG